MNCKICLNHTQPIQDVLVLNSYRTQLHECLSCGFLFLANPDNWIKIAYSNKAISALDTGILIRNNKIKRFIIIFNFLLINKIKTGLEYSAGIGILTRQLRDLGFNFFWQDQFTNNSISNGFEAPTIGNSGIRYDLTTAIECFEHYEDPLSHFELILSSSDRLLLTLEAAPSPAPNWEDWWYYLPETGQHISFYRIETINHISKKFKLHYFISGDLVLFTKSSTDRIPFLISSFVCKLIAKFIDKKPSRFAYSDFLMLKKLK